MDAQKRILPNLNKRELWLIAIAMFATMAAIGAAVAKDDIWSAVDAIGSIFSAFLTGAAVFLAWIGFQQSRKSEQAEYKAYVQVSNVKITSKSRWSGDQEPESYLYANVYVRNYGRTPAKNVFIRLTVNIYSEEPETRVKIEQRGVLHPSQETADIDMGRIYSFSPFAIPTGIIRVEAAAIGLDVYDELIKDIWVGEGKIPSQTYSADRPMPWDLTHINQIDNEVSER